MSDKDSKQTLITKQDDQEWAKVLHGEMKADDENNSHTEALLVRNYLIAKDEVTALQEVDSPNDLNVLSADEARVIYKQASQEIHNRATSPFDRFKGFIAPALIGALSLAVLLLAIPDKYLPFAVKKAESAPEALGLKNASLDFTNSKLIGVGEDPGDYPNMMVIPHGVFTMGCTPGWDDTVGCRPNEYPPRDVSVDAFEMAQHEVTVRQFTKFVEATGYLTDAEIESRGCVHKDDKAEGQHFVMAPEINWRNPGFPQEEQHPVTCISWVDAQAYVKWISEVQGREYRLPSEAEWEFAARGGKATAYFWGSEASPSFANYKGGEDDTEFTSFVGKYSANEYGLQDMAGNLWEWVQDCWHPKYNGAPTSAAVWTDNCNGSEKYTRRGGAWDARAQGIRSAIRSPGAKTDRSVYYGFRVARDHIVGKN